MFIYFVSMMLFYWMGY